MVLCHLCLCLAKDEWRSLTRSSTALGGKESFSSMKNLLLQSNSIVVKMTSAGISVVITNRHSLGQNILGFCRIGEKIIQQMYYHDILKAVVFPGQHFCNQRTSNKILRLLKITKRIVMVQVVEIIKHLKIDHHTLQIRTLWLTPYGRCWRPVLVLNLQKYLKQFGLKKCLL